MKNIIIVLLTFICCISFNANAQVSDREASLIEHSVDKIGRICPAEMWDGWKFRDIIYDKDVNTVYFVIQPKNWKEKDANLTPEKMKALTMFIIENFKEAYQSIVSEKTPAGEGDFMLHLSVGTLLYKMAKTDTNLQIILMNPGCECAVSAMELNKILY